MIMKSAALLSDISLTAALKTAQMLGTILRAWASGIDVQGLLTFSSSLAEQRITFGIMSG